jgi:broad specificity phosphatase PhoE
VTHIYLIRHAQQFSAHNNESLLLADHEDGLTEKGHAQARRPARARR